MNSTFSQFQLWGWSPFFEAAFADWSHSEFQVGRVSAVFQDIYRVMTLEGEALAVLSGQLRHQSLDGEDLPAVGDWVVLPKLQAAERLPIQAILPRRSVFLRKAAGSKLAKQVVAANVDLVFVVTACDHDLNLRRLERYLAVVWESGARPVLVVNKSDLRQDIDALHAQLESITLGVDSYWVSALHGTGLDELKAMIQAGETVALVGSSGVGKSTLVNSLTGSAQLTVAIREDDSKGRHTTTHRELFPMNNGGLIIDTPGMRELQIWQANEGLELGFEDLEALAQDCFYRDCQHDTEHDCAIQAAIARGEFDPGRLYNYLKLQREAAWLDRRDDPREMANSKRRWKKMSKKIRKHKKY